MADAICRWRNGTPKTVVELVNSIPHEIMPIDDFRAFMADKWDGDFFRTPYQLACQLGLYCEAEDGFYYPRFDHEINEREAEEYLLYWFPRYYVPNPYTRKDGFQDISCPTYFLKSLYEYTIENPNCLYKDAYEACFNESAKNNDDIIKNYINKYSRVLTFSKDGTLNITSVNPLTIFPDMDRNNKKEFFDSFDKNYQPIKREYSFQQIYYGAPGTGKSHIINEQVRNESVIRTTFHPDSDYSTFVGCYKPTMKVGKGEIVSITELKKKLFDLKLKSEAYPCQRFGALYWNSLVSLSEKDIKDILTDCGFTENFNVEIAKGISVGKEMSANTEDRIVYEFVEQAFLQAYIQAWKFYGKSSEEVKKQFLVIEEINRGNCAQIFGDLFQLLDRNMWGFSDYPIQADNDMRKQLAKAFSGLEISQENKDRINACYRCDKDYVQQVLNGEILLLPDNLYIWATMNTSDQSLFPIDSAFKRRWDWQYMPIAKGRDNGKNLNWSIVAKDNEYDWWSFLTKINEQIGSTTNSEDKKLGFFFCKAVNGKISAETFVGKVIFYLWNDVFKDFGFDSDIFNDEDESTLSFDKFYSMEDGKVVVQKDKVEKFLKNLGVEVTSVVESDEDSDEEEDEDGNSISSSKRDYSKYSINGVGSYGKNKLASECVKEYIKLNPNMSVDEVVNNWKSLGYIVSHFVESKEEFDARTDNSKERSIEIPCGSSVVYVANDGYGSNGKADVLMNAVNQRDWGITINKIV